jgi:hypothetical protein
MAKGSKGIDVLSSIEKGYVPNDSRQKKIKKRRGGNVEKGSVQIPDSVGSQTLGPEFACEASDACRMQSGITEVGEI